MPAHDNHWCRYPIVWLGVALFTASLLGCALIIALATRHADPALDSGGGAQLLGVPFTANPARTRPP
jgi:hypothetical protein